ncbi:MAG: C10 family peptidase [Chitinispirillaceae bacterium]|nr:C10 family peptidase [Chitinispirillaceae bacterium]
MRIIITVILLSAGVLAQWPEDNEPYGFLGCKQLRYRGYWEYLKDTIHPDEAIDGVCISVALANVMMYYHWPVFSRFDGIYMTSSYDGIIKHIDRSWNYPLITGPRTTSDCATDNPAFRHAANDTSWTGLDELHRLLYAVERSFGFDHNYFKTKDTSACRGDGYYAVEHVMRNRFGYPNGITIDANRRGSRTIVVENLKKNIPVIAMRCDHIYLLDGYTFDQKKNRDMIHSSDYIQEETSNGWFPWKAFYNEKLDRFVVDNYPTVRIGKGLSTKRIPYFWGEGYLPGTHYTERKGRLFIIRENNAALGNLEITVQSKDLTEYANDSNFTLYTTKGVYRKNSIVIPEDGYFNFEVREANRIDLIITNRDPVSKNIRVQFCDEINSKS